MEELTSETNPGSWQRKLLVGTTVCFLVATFLVIQWCFGPFREFRFKRLAVVFAHYLVICCIWGILTIAIQATVARLGFDRRRIVRSTAIYLVIGVGFSGLFFLLAGLPARAIGYLSYGIIRSDGITLFELFAGLNSNLIVFAIIVGSCLAFTYIRRSQDYALQTSRLETQLMKANLNTLKTQLQPHFLFNSLNSIAALMRDNPDSAEEMIVRLGDLLRSTLENVNQDEVTFREEMDFLRRYLEIEKVRFGDRLTVEERIDSTAYDAMVPILLLQPLVENAIHHGVAKVSSPSLVTIHAHQTGTRLCLSITDSGPGRKHSPNIENGIGLENTKERLKCLYDNEYLIRAENRPRGAGFRVSIEIPYRVS